MKTFVSFVKLSQGKVLIVCLLLFVDDHKSQYDLIVNTIFLLYLTVHLLILHETESFSVNPPMF